MHNGILTFSETQIAIHPIALRMGTGKLSRILFVDLIQIRMQFLTLSSICRCLIRVDGRPKTANANELAPTKEPSF